MIQLKGPPISRSHYSILYLKRKSRNVFLLKWFDMNFIYVKWTPFSPANETHSSSITQESHKHDIARRKMASHLEEGDQCSTRYREIFTECGCYKAIPFSCLLSNMDHSCNRKFSFLQQPKTHQLGIIANVAYFSLLLSHMLYRSLALWRHFSVSLGESPPWNNFSRQRKSRTIMVNN